MTTFIRLTQKNLGSLEGEDILVQVSHIGTIRRPDDTTFITVDGKTVWVVETPDEIMRAIGLAETVIEEAPAPVATRGEYVMPEHPPLEVLKILGIEDGKSKDAASIRYYAVRAALKEFNNRFVGARGVS